MTEIAYIQTNKTFEIDDVDTNILVNNSGAIFSVISALTGDRNVALPAVKKGLHYRIILKFDLAHNLVILAQANGLFCGLLLNTGAAALATLKPKNGTNTITFNNAAKKGDYLDIICDGVNWYVSGMSTALGFT